MLTVSNVPTDDRASALTLLFSNLPDEERDEQVAEMLDSAGLGEISLDGLLAVTDDRQMLGVVLYVLQADGTAFVWPARVRTDGEQSSLVDALIQDVCRRFDENGVWLGQCVLETDATADRAALCRNGFTHLSDLCYLQRSFNSLLPQQPDVACEAISFSPASNRERFEKIIEQTYIGTLDCPEFHGYRTGSEALESHRLSGEFHPDRWWVFSVNQEDVGVLLMNDHPAKDAWEVVYMGVAPSARGKGYGRAILWHGLDEARRAGRGSVLLAVDGKNLYANNIYNGMGFIEIASRAVHVRMRENQGSR